MLAEEYKAISKILVIYILPVFIFTGLFGNLLIGIIVRKHFTSSSSKIFIISLVIVQSLKICMFGVTPWLREILKLKSEASNFACQFVLTIGFIFKSLSVYILLCASVDRFIAVAFPFFWRTNVKAKHAVILLLVITGLSIAKDAYNYQMAKLERILDEILCEPVADMEVTGHKLYIWVDLIIGGIIPALGIVLSNVGIVYCLHHARRSVGLHHDKPTRLPIPNKLTDGECSTAITAPDGGEFFDPLSNKNIASVKQSNIKTKNGLEASWKGKGIRASGHRDMKQNDSTKVSTTGAVVSQIGLGQLEKMPETQTGQNNVVFAIVRQTTTSLIVISTVNFTIHLCHSVLTFNWLYGGGIGFLSRAIMLIVVVLNSSLSVLCFVITSKMFRNKTKLLFKGLVCHESSENVSSDRQNLNS